MKKGMIEKTDSSLHRKACRLRHRSTCDSIENESGIKYRNTFDILCVVLMQTFSIQVSYDNCI